MWFFFLRREFFVYGKSHDLLAFHIGCLSVDIMMNLRNTRAGQNNSTGIAIWPIVSSFLHYFISIQKKNASSFISHMTLFILLHTSPTIHGFTHITHFIFTICSCLVWNLRPFWFNVCLFMPLRHVFIWIELYGKRYTYINK